VDKWLSGCVDGEMRDEELKVPSVELSILQIHK